MAKKDLDHSMHSARETKDPKPSPQVKDCRLLPEDFDPLPYSVIIGRGNITKASIGNRRLDVLASSFLERYVSSTSKAKKTEVVCEIMATIRNACPVGAFIRYEDGRWWEVGDGVAREKVGYCLRNLLHDKYKTSARSKTERRKQRKSEKRRASLRASEEPPTRNEPATRRISAPAVNHTTPTSHQRQRAASFPHELLYQTARQAGTRDPNSEKVICNRLRSPPELPIHLSAVPSRVEPNFLPRSNRDHVNARIVDGNEEDFSSMIFEGATFFDEENSKN